MVIEKGAKNVDATKVDENVLKSKEKLKYLTESEVGNILKNALASKSALDLTMMKDAILTKRHCDKMMEMIMYCALPDTDQTRKKIDNCKLYRPRPS